MKDIELIESLISMGNERNKTDTIALAWLKSIKEKIEDGKTMEEALNELEKEVI